MKQAVNILMLGGAKRVSMARMIKRAGTRLGMAVNLFSYELTSEVPIAEVATVVKGLRWSDPDIMDHLHTVVEENRIDILLPFVDPAVEIAIRYASADASVWTPGGTDAKMSAVMFNKIEADALFHKLGFPLPSNPQYEPVEGDIIAKPCFGSASKGIRILSKAEYEQLDGSSESGTYLFQKYIAHRKEYTVDCYVASDGEVVCAVPRERIAVSGGEVTETETIHDSEIENASHRILKALQLRGPVTLQFLRDADTSGDSRALLMEINPRLGGGAVCSVHAGADIPLYMLSDFAGLPLKQDVPWRPGTRICRYPQEVVFYK